MEWIAERDGIMLPPPESYHAANTAQTVDDKRAIAVCLQAGTGDYVSVGKEETLMAAADAFLRLYADFMAQPSPGQLPGLLWLAMKG